MSALRDKVRQNWFRKQGWYAPKAGQSYVGNHPQSSAEVNAQRPNRKRKRVLVGKKRQPRFKAF